MKADTSQSHMTVERLRADFDGVFAEPAVTEHVARQVLIAIRVGGDPYALPVDGLAGLQARGTLVPIPSNSDALLGLAGISGHIVPVFRLPLLLGYSVADEQLRWFAMWGEAPRVGLAFETVEGTLQVDRAAIHAVPAELNQQRLALASAVLQTTEMSRNVLDLARIMERIVTAARR